MTENNERFWDQSYWHFDDKDWRAVRKDEWKIVQNNLKRFAITEFRGGYMKEAKNLFFKGEVSDQIYVEAGAYVLGSTLPVLLIWFHPNFNEHEQAKFIEWSVSSARAIKAMEKSRAFCSLFAPKIMEDEFEDKYGLFGGKEEKIAELLWGKPLIGAPFDQIGWDRTRKVLMKREEVSRQSHKTRLRLVKGERPTLLFWGALSRFFSQPVRGKNQLGLYFFEHANAVGVPPSKTTFTADCVRAAIEKIQTFDPSQAQDAPSDLVALVDTLRQKYESKDLHPDFIKIWDEVVANKV